MGPFNSMQMMISQLENNPNITNNPQAMHVLDVVRSGNAEEGRRLAQELCQNYGVQMQDAAQQARNFFQFQGR